MAAGADSVLPILAPVPGLKRLAEGRGNAQKIEIKKGWTGRGAAG